MKLTVVEKKSKEVVDPETKEKKVEIEKIEHEFETHPCELVESAEKRLRKQIFGLSDKELDATKVSHRMGTQDGIPLRRGLTMGVLITDPYIMLLSFKI